MKPILTQHDAPDPATMGGKAAALAELGAHKLPIPAWFVISPDAYDNRDGVTAAIDAAVRELSPNEEAIFAVRSSAVDEDAAEHSFAGQLESYLFVPTARVFERVEDVWKSGFSDRVITYRREHGLPPPTRAPAVIVQQMIDAAVSGVAFAADPISGNRSTVVISAVFGLGTALVGGDADCDTYRLDRSGRLIEQRVAKKTIRHVADPSAPQGVREESLADADAKRVTLDGNQLRQIVELVLTVSRIRQRPQDIEWAIDRDGKLFLLQARPITSLSALPDPDGVRIIWDNSNIAESYSGITTPLTFTFARRAYDGAYRQFCRIMKVAPRVIEENDAMFGQMLGLIRGRVYYNLLNWYRLLAMLPGFSVNQRFMEQMMGVREGLPAEIANAVRQRAWSRRQADRFRLAMSALGLVRSHLRLRSTIAAFYARLNTALAPPPTPLEEMRIDQLAAAFRTLESQLITRWDAPLINDFLAMIFFGALGKLCASWCGGDGSANLQNDLIGDEGGVISTEPAKRIAEMGKLAAGDEQLVDALCDAEAPEAQSLLREPLLSMYRSYLDKFGDRCLEELKLESSTLVDDPTPLLRSIGQTARRLRESGEPPRPFRPREAAERRVAETLRRRRRPLRRAVFNWVLKHARRRVRDRENLRFERTRLFGRVRRIFVEIGRRSFAEGLLEEPRDVFYLTLDEVLGFVEGTSVTDDMKSLAAMRRERFARYRDEPAPAERFETRGAVYVGNRFEATSSPTTSGTDGELHGIGCCPGVTRGPVRIIRDPRGALLRHGEILVAERTDPGWIMLFPAAAGILVERGSLLSHSAIVARELGIPAVVSIPKLTASVVDGEWVEMDGATGRVVRIPTDKSLAAEAASPAVG
jgi:pyruvate,water dikinase